MSLIPEHSTPHLRGAFYIRELMVFILIIGVIKFVCMYVYINYIIYMVILIA